MDKFVIHGGKPLHGEVEISGSKNATLPLMAAALDAGGKYVFENVPDLKDVKTLAHLLRIIGAQVDYVPHKMIIDTSRCNFFEAPYELVKTMRASIYVLGPLLGRFGRAKVSLPGGCAWGPRPVDLHLKGMQMLGAQIDLEGGYIIAKAQRLKGTKIHFDISSVGATGNILMAAVLAQGTTIIENAAREPEIEALEHFLVKMGARIEGVGTDTLIIEGVDELKPTNETMIPDRIEAGTFMVAGAITGGDITLKNVRNDHIAALIAKLEEAGVQIETNETTLRINAQKPLKPVNITTAVYPGFPTDMQAQWISLMSVTNGVSIIKDTIFLDRFNHVPELRRLGADITTNENTAIIRGISKLKGAPVMSTDLRASASLIIAGLAAEGTTEILRIYHIDRGYEAIEKKLQGLGADIHRTQTPMFKDI